MSCRKARKMLDFMVFINFTDYRKLSQKNAIYRIFGVKLASNPKIIGVNINSQ